MRCQKKVIKFTKNGMSIGGEIYGKSVPVPDPAAILQLSPEDITDILAIKMVNGHKISSKGSEFIAYTMATNSLVQIRKGYMMIKLEHPGARHVVAVWRIPGSKKFEVEDFQDDNECGAGRICLNLLKDSGVSHRVFYVVRYYGGQKMGSERFTCYLKAMQSALRAAKENPLTCTKQSIQLETLDTSAHEVRQKLQSATYGRKNDMAKRGRGGARGTRGRGRSSYQANRGRTETDEGGGEKRKYIPRDDSEYEDKKTKKKQLREGVDIDEDNANTT